MDLKDLSKYTLEDIQKRQLIDTILDTPVEIKLCALEYSSYADSSDIDYAFQEPFVKFCPECGREYPRRENFCLDCLVNLKDIKHINIKNIDVTPEFNVKKTNKWDSFEEILTNDNLEKMKEFRFAIEDFKQIVKDIKKTAFLRLDKTIKDNEIYLANLSIFDKVLLFTKSFVNVEYKSYGGELGYFEFNRIYVDDRQLQSLQITTLLHELSHFILKEMIAHILCEVLDCMKTSEIESIAVFILSYTPINQLIDEYAAHTVEGRFTLFGYQDYSSYLTIEKTIDAPAEEIEMIKTIANSFANYIIKEILESFIDQDLLEDIKSKFRKEILDRPDYRNLALENCSLLNDEGMIHAIRFVVVDGFAVSMRNIETLNRYVRNWK